jgi:hypothetical protein
LNYDKLLKSILPHIKWNYKYNGNINKFKSNKGKIITIKVKKPINNGLTMINPHYFIITVKGNYDSVVLKEVKTNKNKK